MSEMEFDIWVKLVGEWKSERQRDVAARLRWYSEVLKDVFINGDGSLERRTVEPLN